MRRFVRFCSSFARFCSSYRTILPPKGGKCSSFGIFSVVAPNSGNPQLLRSSSNSAQMQLIAAHLQLIAKSTQNRATRDDAN